MKYLTTLFALLLSLLAVLLAGPVLAQSASPIVITSISPNPVISGGVITITGHGLNPTASYFLNHPEGYTVPLLNVLASGESASAKMPPYTPGSYNLVVQDGLNVSNSFPVTLVSNAAPTTPSLPVPVTPTGPTSAPAVITGVTPNPVPPGQYVTLSGQNLTLNHDFLLHQGSLTRTLNATAGGSRATVYIPYDLPLGTYTITAVNALDGSQSNPITITVDNPVIFPSPTIFPWPSPFVWPSPTPCGFPSPRPLPSPAVIIPPFNPCPTPPPGQSVQYVALGDSVANGLLSVRGYVAQYGDRIEQFTQRPITINNLAVNGWTSTDLLNALRSDQNYRQAVGQADVVTWNIGGNDLRAARTAYKQGQCGGPDNQQCLRDTVAQIKSNHSAIITELQNLTGGHQVHLQTMDLYNPYVNEDQRVTTTGTQNDFAVFKGYFDEVNVYLRNSAAGTNVRVASVYKEFNGIDGTEDPFTKGLIAIDGFHPNFLGHQVIANSFALPQPTYILNGNDVAQDNGPFIPCFLWPWQDACQAPTFPTITFTPPDKVLTFTPPQPTFTFQPAQQLPLSPAY